MAVIQTIRGFGRRWGRTAWRDLPCVGALLGLLAILGGCGTISLSNAPLEMDNATGTVLQTAEGHLISPEALLDNMLHAQVIYLGEQHDNPYHHRLQRAILEKLLAHGKRPAIGFEFFSRDQTGWLMNFTLGKPSPFALPQSDDPGETLRKKLGWEKRPEWAFYFPLLQLARTHHLPVFGADLPDGLRVRLARNDLAELSAIEKAEWTPTHFVHEDYQQLMLKKLALAHCGMAPESLLQRLYVTWVARNDAMAQAIALMRTAAPDEPVVMVLGAGHVAHDMGVHERVAFLQPGIHQVNLGFQEIHPEDPPLPRPFEPVRVGQTPFAPDHPFLWFTPPAPDREDPCAPLLSRSPSPPR